MRPEDQLDALLDQRARGRFRQDGTPDELRPLVAAASRLDRFRDAAPDAAFTRDLETRMLAHMAAQANATPAPRRIERANVQWWGALPLRTRATWAAVAAVLLLTVGLGALTAKAAPGGPLSIVRRFAQTIEARTNPSPMDLFTADLAQAKADLSAYQQAMAHGDTSSALGSLTTLQSDDQRAATELKSITDGSQRADAQSQLAAFHHTANDALRATLPSLSLQGRAQVTDELRAWGFTSLFVKQARIEADERSTSHDTHGSSTVATVLVELHGAGFAQGAIVAIDGRTYTSLVTLTSNLIVARVPAAVLGAGDHTVGVENPDGTVALAQSLDRADQSHAGATGTPSPDASNHGNAVAPTATVGDGAP